MTEPQAEIESNEPNTRRKGCSIRFVRFGAFEQAQLTANRIQ